MTTSDIVLTKPTPAMIEAMTTSAIMRIETMCMTSSACALSAALRSHVVIDSDSAALPEANVVTRPTPMTRPSVARVARIGSATALRRAMRASGPAPSRRPKMATRRGRMKGAPVMRPRRRPRASRCTPSSAQIGA